MARHGAGMLNPVVEAEVDAEVDADAEVEADIAKRLDISLDASDLFDDFDVDAVDETEVTPFLGVFEEAEAEAVADTKTIQDFGWF
jgi:hypothetical protein